MTEKQALDYIKNHNLSVLIRNQDDIIVSCFLESTKTKISGTGLDVIAAVVDFKQNVIKESKRVIQMQNKQKKEINSLLN